ncbi:MAG: MCP four helix bundle domain-containing protein, partial [Gallionella sp.]
MKWFLNLRIGMRLGLGFGILLLLMAMVIYMGITRMAEINDRLDGIVNDDHVKEQLAQDMRQAVRSVSIAVRNVVLLEDKSDIKTEVQRIQDQRTQYDADIEKLGTSVMNAEGQAILARIREEQTATRPLVDKSVDLGLANK